MSMRSVADKRTVCEVLREINDLIQQSSLRPKVTPLLFEAEQMCKKMARKLYEYNKEFDKDWWKNNTNIEEKLKRRLDENYVCH